MSGYPVEEGFEVHEELVYELGIIETELIINESSRVYFLDQVELGLSQYYLLWMLQIVMHCEYFVGLFGRMLLQDCNNHLEQMPISVLKVLQSLCGLREH